MKPALLPIFTLLSIGLCSAQTNNFRPIEKDFADTIAIEYVNDQIIIPVAINGRTHRFIFDTGAGIAFIRQSIIPEGSVTLEEAVIYDANDTRQDKDMVLLDGVSIGEMHFPAFPVVPDPFENLPWMDCIGVDGFIGGAIFQDLAIKTDIKRRILIITDRKGFFKADKGYNSPVTIIGYRPYINIKLGRTEEKNVLFDTGSDSFYTLSNGVFETLQRSSQKRWGGEVVSTAVGSSTMGVFGTHEAMPLSLVRLSDLNIGGFSFSNVNTVTTLIPYSHIGAQIFRYGDIIVDYPAKSFTFLPYDSGTSATVDTENNFSLGLKDGHIVVSLVWESSDAYRQGIRRGDIVTEINLIRINDDICKLMNARRGKLEQVKVIDSDGNEKEYRFPRVN